jgi:plastocyanin domain-containing protein
MVRHWHPRAANAHGKLGGAGSDAASPADVVRVRMNGNGFEPPRITVKSGQLVRLAFTRDESVDCGQTVVFPDLGLERKIAPGETVVVEVRAVARGEELRFTCGKGMYKGVLAAEKL